MVFRVINLIGDKVAPDIESISIVAKHHKKEACNSKCCFKVSLNSGSPCSSKVFIIVSNLCVFLTESLNNSDSIKSLFGISSTLTIRFEILAEATLHSHSQEIGSYEDKREKC